MELEEYIKQTLHSVINAVGDSQKIFSEKGIVIYPSTIKEGYISIEGHKKVMDIKFDIAVTVEKKQENEKGFSIQVVELITGGIKTLNSLQNQSISRISFEVPVLMPVVDELTENAERIKNENLRKIKV